MLRAAAIVAMLALAACSDPAEPDSVRPGDSLFELADDAHVRSYPETNLEPPVARAVQAALEASSTGDFETARATMTTRVIDDWVFGRPFDNSDLDEALRDFIPDDLALRLYTARPGVVPTDGPPIVLRDGRPDRAWNFRKEPFPGELIYWDDANGSLRAIAPSAPVGIRLQYTSAIADEFGAWERRLALSGTDPEVGDLMRRVELAEVSRPVILAPPPSRISYDLPTLAVDALAVSVGLVDHAWRGTTLRSGTTAIERTSGLADGVAFAIDVTTSTGETTRAWTRELGSEALGKSFVDDTVDLTAWRGQAVTLELITAVPTGKLADHAYAVWSDLRFAGPPARAPRRPHVVMIDIDTLRPDRLGIYGYERPTSPRLDAWARDNAVVFESARTTGPYTLPTTASIMTGLDVHQHDVDHLSKALSPAAGPIASVLHAVGYETHGVAEGAYLSPSFGFDHGFDTYVTAKHKAPDWSATLDWVADRRSERPLFLFLHTYLVHAPFEYDDVFVQGHGGRYDPGGERYDGWLAGQTVTNEIVESFRRGEVEFDADDRGYVNDLYDALVLRMDTLVADTLAAVRASLGDDVLVIFLSDHGEEFFERDMLAHGHTLYNELLHVPLIVAFPDGRVGRDRRPASVIDVVPTILDLVGLEQPSHLPGYSLAAPAPDTRTLVARFAGRAHAIESASGWKLIRGRVHTPRGDLPDPQLFDLGIDAGERNDLATREEATREDLTEQLDEYLTTWKSLGPAATGNAGSATLENLRKLGYMVDEDGK